MFASMYAAYDVLSDGLKATLEGLSARHSSRHVFGEAAQARRGDLAGRIGNAELATQDAVHPVVIRHPDTGRKALYVNPGFTLGFDGWTDDESRPLLDYLCQDATRPEFTCRFHWREGSLALWDNRSTWHFAVNGLSRRASPAAPRHDRRCPAELKGDSSVRSECLLHGAEQPMVAKITVGLEPAGGSRSSMPAVAPQLSFAAAAGLAELG
jgi:alpha-ketoglutarate-dependent taurine dioxygenase